MWCGQLEWNKYHISGLNKRWLPADQCLQKSKSGSRTASCRCIICHSAIAGVAGVILKLFELWQMDIDLTDNPAYLCALNTPIICLLIYLKYNVNLRN
jgi:hypothetical protein